MTAPLHQARGGVFDRITRGAMYVTGLLILLVGAVVLIIAAPPVLAGAWLMDRGRGA